MESLSLEPSWKSHGCTRHPLDWMLWCTPLMASATNDDYPFFFLSYFVFLISCLQMLALDLQHHNTILVLAVWGGERSIYWHIVRPFHHSLVLWDLNLLFFFSFLLLKCACVLNINNPWGVLLERMGHCCLHAQSLSSI